MDVATFMVRLRCAMVINEKLNIHINENLLRIKLMDQAQDPIGLTVKSNQGKVTSLKVKESILEASSNSWEEDYRDIDLDVNVEE